MADSDWESVEDQESRDLEKQRISESGEMPGHNRSKDESPWGAPDPRAGEEQREVTETYSALTYVGLGERRSVSHTCNHCGDHTDTYSEIFGFPLGGNHDHAGANHWGFQSGMLYLSVHVVGTVYRRIEKQGRRPKSGGGMTDPYPLSYRWEKRTIDHIEQRPYISWEDLAVVDCIHGVRPRSVSQIRDEEWETSALVAFLVRRKLVGTGLSFTDGAGVLPSVAAFFADPQESTERRVRIEGRTAIVEFGKAGKVAATLELELDVETSTARTKAWRTVK